MRLLVLGRLLTVSLMLRVRFADASLLVEPRVQ
jgi:hypothetical protein